MAAISILLPVYNSAKTLCETLKSVQEQSFRDFELLVIDDGSTDGSPEILRAWKDPRLRVIRNSERLRLAGALNRGIDEAQAPLIARIDADDLAHPARLQRQHDFMSANADIVLCGTWTRHFGERSKARECYPGSWEELRAFSLFNCPFAHPTTMFRRDFFIRKNLRYDGSYYPTEDYELWSRVVQEYPCANLPEVLLHYRVHANSMTGSDWTNMDEQATRVIRNQLAALGLQVSEAESRLQRDIGMARVPPERLPEARDWLETLLHSPALRDFPALPSEVRERWFHVCMNASRGGASVLSFYRSRPLWAESSPPLSRCALLLASILRRSRP